MRGIVITGASSGLGAALARSHAGAGVLLGLTGRDATRLEAVAADCRAAGAETQLLVADVAEAEPLGAWLLSVEARAPIAILIANAGISASSAPDAAHEGLVSVSRQIRINLLGVVNTIEPLLPALIGRGQGSIAVIASMAALRGMPYSPGYCASKAGVRAYGEALRALLSPKGVRVSVVCPGFFTSPMTDHWQGPKPFLWTLDRAATRIKRGISKGERRITFPFWLALGTRLADLLPAWLGDIIMRDFRFHIVER